MCLLQSIGILPLPPRSQFGWRAVNSPNRGQFGSKGCLEHEIAREVCNVLGLDEPKLVSIQPDWIYEFGNELSLYNECNHSSLDLTTQYGFAKVMGTDYDCFLNGIFGGHISYGSPYFTDSALNVDKLNDETTARLFRGLEGPRYDLFIKSCASSRLNDLSLTYRHKTLKEEWEKGVTTE